MMRSSRWTLSIKKIGRLPIGVLFLFLFGQVLGEKPDVEIELQPSLRLFLDDEFSASLELALKLSESYPDSRSVWSLIGRNYFLLEEYESARLAFEKFLVLDGDFEEIASEFILTLLFIGEEEDFESYGDQILDLEPGSLAIAVAQLAILSDRGEREEFDRLLVDLPDEFLETRIVSLTIARCVWYFAKEKQEVVAEDTLETKTSMGSDSESND